MTRRAESKEQRAARVERQLVMLRDKCLAASAALPAMIAELNELIEMVNPTRGEQDEQGGNDDPAGDDEDDGHDGPEA